jgi:hypothetical protein
MLSWDTLKKVQKVQKKVIGGNLFHKVLKSQSSIFLSLFR